MTWSLLRTTLLPVPTVNRHNTQRASEPVQLEMKRHSWDDFTQRLLFPNPQNTIWRKILGTSSRNIWAQLSLQKGLAAPAYSVRARQRPRHDPSCRGTASKNQRGQMVSAESLLSRWAGRGRAGWQVRMRAHACAECLLCLWVSLLCTQNSLGIRDQGRLPGFSLPHKLTQCQPSLNYRL